MRRRRERRGVRLRDRRRGLGRLGSGQQADRGARVEGVAAGGREGGDVPYGYTAARAHHADHRLQLGLQD